MDAFQGLPLLCIPMAGVTLPFPALSLSPGFGHRALSELYLFTWALLVHLTACSQACFSPPALSEQTSVQKVASKDAFLGPVGQLCSTAAGFTSTVSLCLFLHFLYELRTSHSLLEKYRDFPVPSLLGDTHPHNFPECSMKSDFSYRLDFPKQSISLKSLFPWGFFFRVLSHFPSCFV